MKWDETEEGGRRATIGLRGTEKDDPRRYLLRVKDKFLRLMYVDYALAGYLHAPG